MDFSEMIRQTIALGTEAHLRAGESQAWEALGQACTASALTMVREDWLTEEELDALCDPADVTVTARLATDGDDFESLAVRALELAVLAERIGEGPDGEGPPDAYNLGAELYSRVHGVATVHLGDATTDRLVDQANTLTLSRLDMIGR